MTIHATAVVHPNAVLADTVDVGPYVVIGENVTVAAGTTIGSHVVIEGRTDIGEDCKISPFVSIGTPPQHLRYQGEDTMVKIGRNNTLREFVTVNRATEFGGGITKIGDDNLLMAYVHIAHDSLLGDNTLFANGASLAGHVEVGDFAILGGFTLIHQFCRVGSHSITGIGTVCLKDVPPYVMASGNPAKPYGINTKGLRRRGFKEDDISGLRVGYRWLYRSNKDIQSALDEIRLQGQSQKVVQKFVSFVASSERGIIR